MSKFEDMEKDITGDTWLDELARESVRAAAARFDGRPPQASPRPDSSGRGGSFAAELIDASRERLEQKHRGEVA